MVDLFLINLLIQICLGDVIMYSYLILNKKVPHDYWILDVWFQNDSKY